jgi:hypothetical protein
VLAPISDAAFDELDRKFRISRKSEEAQSVLWFPVYDNDHPPRMLDAYQPHWLPALRERSGWKVFGPRLSFESLQNPIDYVILAGKEIRAGNAYNMRTGALPSL